MLHKETLEPATLELIQILQSDPQLKGFILVGGTALSLLIGHRISIDIDLFTQEDFDAQTMLQHLEKRYSFALQYSHQNTLKGFINSVFVDLISHPYPWIRKPVSENNLVISSKEDIAAMKINAISGNGTRAKDFVDIYFLLKEFSMKEVLGFYAEKYSQRNTFHALKSITYFADMDTSPWPNMVREKDLGLQKLKEELVLKSEEYLQSL